jgi:antitoxin VapB
MALAKVFQSGNSQAIRLPKEFRLQVKEVELVQHGEDILIREAAPRSFASALEQWATMPEDFFAEARVDPPPQQREEF